MGQAVRYHAGAHEPYEPQHRLGYALGSRARRGVPVVFLLGNLVAVGLPVDDGGHTVLSFFRSGFHGNPAYLGSMPADLIRQLQAVEMCRRDSCNPRLRPD